MREYCRSHRRARTSCRQGQSIAWTCTLVGWSFIGMMLRLIQFVVLFEGPLLVVEIIGMKPSETKLHECQHT